MRQVSPRIDARQRTSQRQRSNNLLRTLDPGALIRVARRLLFPGPDSDLEPARQRGADGDESNSGRGDDPYFYFAGSPAEGYSCIVRRSQERGECQHLASDQAG